ncbi:MAG: hypothetical protein ACK4TA_20065 [Saprospiraceae bacterium]
MVHRNADNILKHLEKASADELAYLESVGAEYYSTAQLLRLKGQWEIKYQLFWQFQQFLMRCAASTPIWLLLWFVFDLLKWKWLSLFSLALCPLCFFIFFAGLLFIRKFFRSKGYLESVREMIDYELLKRQLSPKDIY